MKYDIDVVLSRMFSSYNNQYTITGSDYNTLVWDEYNAGIPKPSLEYLQDEVDKLNNLKPIDILREERNKLLDSTDKYLTLDFVYTVGTTKEDWITYRQELRDLPATSTPQIDDNDELTNVIWPSPPS